MIQWYRQCHEPTPLTPSAGEWFVQDKEFSFQHNGLHPSLRRFLEIPRERRGYVYQVRLGPNGTFYAKSEKQVVWRMTQDFTESVLKCTWKYE